MLTTRTVRVLDEADRQRVEALLDASAVSGALVASRVRAHGVAGRLLGGRLWGYCPHGTVESLCWSGANLVPLTADPRALAAFAAAAREQGRVCSSIVGPATAVLPLWRHLAPSWGLARAVRRRQPLLATAAPAPVPPDPAVRRARLADVEALLPACVAMYTEEVGVSPVSGGGTGYRDRLVGLVRSGRSYVRVEDGQVVFKAELGAVSRRVCQVQGVWVRPDRRGAGIATAGMAAVVGDALDTVAPVVSLYVNDFNVAARAVYARCGFTQVDTFATVLF